MSIYENRTVLIFCVVCAALLGAMFGSFLHCAAWRAARHESVMKGRSRCPACGHVLGAPDLVPIFSWLFLRGRCRHCGTKIPPRYVLAEALFALATVLCLLRFDLTVLFARNWVFLGCLFCLSITDLDSYEIPDACLIIAAAAWLAAEPFLWQGWLDAGLHLLAGVVFGGGLLIISLVMDRILKKESMGGGDIKLFAVVGLYLGLIGTLFSLLLACVLGLVMAAALRRGRSQPFPFGPAIALSAAVMLLYGDGLVALYMGLF